MDAQILNLFLKFLFLLEQFWHWRFEISFGSDIFGGFFGFVFQKGFFFIIVENFLVLPCPVDVVLDPCYLSK